MVEPAPKRCSSSRTVSIRPRLDWKLVGSMRISFSIQGRESGAAGMVESSGKDPAILLAPGGLAKGRDLPRSTASGRRCQLADRLRLAPERFIDFIKFL